MDHLFVLELDLPVGVENHEEILAQLESVGCTDALPLVGQPGKLGLEFMRQSSSMQAAVLSAIDDVQRGLPQARLVRITSKTFNFAQLPAGTRLVAAH